MGKIEQVESWILALIAKVGLWLTPAIPAYFVQRAMEAHLGTPAGWSWAAAVALEIVGIAATKNLLRAYTWEQERRKTDPPAPMGWYVLAAMIYYLVAFLVVLVVEFWTEAVKAAPAAFVVLGGTAALTIALADDQNRRQRAVREMSAERSVKRSVTRSVTGVSDREDVSGMVSNPDTDRLAAARKAKQEAAEQALLTFLADHPHASHGEAAGVVGRSRPWVSGKLAEWEAAGVVHRNGNGYKIAS